MGFGVFGFGELVCTSLQTVLRRQEKYCSMRTKSRLDLNDMQHAMAVFVSVLVLSLAASAAERLRFWNLTGFAIKELRLAPVGTADWGPDQCTNDPDGAVDVDERLTLKDVVPGDYDVKLVDQSGRICVVRNVEVSAGKPYAFSLSENELVDCR